MPLLYWVSVTIHVLAAMLWLGGMLFLGAVGAPVLRAVEPPAMRQRLFQDLGARFLAFGWTAIALLVVTGTANLYYRGWLFAMGSRAFWSTAAGHALMGKLTTVVVMLVVQAVHDFWLGPRASRVTPGSPDALRLRRRAALLARANAFVGIVLVMIAVRLARS